MDPRQSQQTGAPVRQPQQNAMWSRPDEQRDQSHRGPGYPQSNAYPASSGFDNNPNPNTFQQAAYNTNNNWRSPPPPAIPWAMSFLPPQDPFSQPFQPGTGYPPASFNSQSAMPMPMFQSFGVLPYGAQNFGAQNLEAEPFTAFPATQNFFNPPQPSNETPPLDGGNHPPPSSSSPLQQQQREEREPIVPPSAASGGIPEPTAAYLARAALPYRARRQPQPLLIVLDLNGTLLFRPRRKQPQRFVARPHALDFLRYCLRTFHVVIWSSARPDNVVAMVASPDLLSPAERASLVAVWARDRFALSRADYARRVQCYKRLSLLWADDTVAASHPGHDAAAAAGGAAAPVRWDQSNTVLVDDSVEKGRSEPHNLIQIPEFAGQDEKDDVLPQVHDYINHLACQEDVSAYIRANPFRLQAGGWKPQAEALS